MIVDIIAPSYPLAIELKLIMDVASKFGFIARIPDNLQIENADPFCASDDGNRFQQLVNAINAADSKHIWAFRGGYGAARLLPMLDEYYCLSCSHPDESQDLVREGARLREIPGQARDDYTGDRDDKQHCHPDESQDLVREGARLREIPGQARDDYTGARDDCTGARDDEQHCRPDESQGLFVSSPKIFIGFSDATALHIYFIQKFGWQTIHGRGISEYARGMGTEQEVLRLKHILAGGKTIFENLKPLNAAAKNDIVVNSKIVGGNLCLIENSLGTSWHIDTEGKIILIEEVGERGYRIDRMLVHLQQAGVFTKAKAVIFGEIICAKEPDGKEICDVAIARFAASLNIPVVQIDTIGHGAENWPVPLNTNSVLKLGAVMNLEIDAI